MAKETESKELPEVREGEAVGFFKAVSQYWSIAAIAATFFINYGIFQSNYEHVQKRLIDLEALKLEQLKWVSEQHEHRLTTVELEQKAVRDTVFDMKTKIDVIASWVRDQREDHRR